MNELEQYHKILCSEYPYFIDKYIEILELQRLKFIDQFCGAYYTKLYNIKYWYSRLDHSISVALMTHHFTGDKEQTLAALFHDLGTPCFSHCIDYLLNDPINQASSEVDIYDIINNSSIKDLLKEDGIDINLFKDISKYSIVENEKPKICVDRLDGVLHTCLIWLQYFDINDIKEIYDDLTILINENNEQEIGFKNIEIADKFFEGVFEYSMALQKNDDKYFMQYEADAIRVAINKKLFTISDLYKLKENQVIDILKNNVISYNIFENCNSVISTDIKPNQYYVSVESKKRYVNPLVMIDNKVVRLSNVSNICKQLLDEYQNFHDKKYVYIKDIKQIN